MRHTSLSRCRHRRRGPAQPLHAHLCAALRPAQTPAPLLCHPLTLLLRFRTCSARWGRDPPPWTSSAGRWVGGCGCAAWGGMGWLVPAWGWGCRDGASVESTVGSAMPPTRRLRGGVSCVVVPAAVLLRRILAAVDQDIISLELPRSAEEAKQSMHFKAGMAGGGAGSRACRAAWRRRRRRLSSMPAREVRAQDACCSPPTCALPHHPPPPPSPASTCRTACASALWATSPTPGAPCWPRIRPQRPTLPPPCWRRCSATCTG